MSHPEEDPVAAMNAERLKLCEPAWNLFFSSGLPSSKQGSVSFAVGKTGE
jgi:hypothetical protein